MPNFSVARSIDKPASHGWFIAHCVETREHAAACAMLRDGLPCYMPGVLITTRYRCRHIRKVRLPLFPEYVFVALNRENPPSMRAWRRHGVEGLLNFTGGALGRAWEVPARAVGLIWRAERDGLLKRDVDKTRLSRVDTEEELRRMGLAIGQEVDWDWDGIARGGEDARVRAVAKIIEVEPDSRVRLLYHLFSREIETVVQLDKLAAG